MIFSREPSQGQVGCFRMAPVLLVELPYTYSDQDIGDLTWPNLGKNNPFLLGEVFRLEKHDYNTCPNDSDSAHNRGENSVLIEREFEVLKAAARGERSKEIALHLGIAERTVKAHLDSIYNKPGVDSRAAAVATALERGLLTKQN